MISGSGARSLSQCSGVANQPAMAHPVQEVHDRHATSPQHATAEALERPYELPPPAYKEVVKS